MKKQAKKIQHVENLISDSLRFHGLLTPSLEKVNEAKISLPEYLNDSEFLFKRETGKIIQPKLRLAAFKSNRKK